MGQDSWAVRRLSLLLLTSIVAAACLGGRPKIKHPEVPREVTTLTLAGQFSIPALGRFPPVIGSAVRWHLGADDQRRRPGDLWDLRRAARRPHLSVRHRRSGWIAAGDDAQPWCRCRWRRETTAPTTRGSRSCRTAPSPSSAEGGAGEPRLPPSINVYGRHGDFVCRLPLPDKFVPEATGPATRGARGNAGFESLTLSPDGERLFTAAETALIQDGDRATFEAGARTRILECVARRSHVRAGREFAYDLEPVQKPPYAARPLHQRPRRAAGAEPHDAAGARARIRREQGEPGAEPQSHPRLYRVSLTGATDVSALESLKGHRGGRPGHQDAAAGSLGRPGAQPGAGAEPGQLRRHGVRPAPARRAGVAHPRQRRQLQRRATDVVSAVCDTVMA